MARAESSSGDRLRLGLVGYGAAARLMLRSLTEKKFDVVGVADTDPVVRAAFSEQWGAPAYPSLEALLADAQLDAAYVATPTKFHEEHAISVLDAGLPVLVEKPMAVTIDSALAMIDASRRNSVPLLENHKRSFDRPIITMWKLVESGLTGRLHAVHRWHYSSWFYRPRAEEERDPKSGGIVLRQGAHEFDILRLLVQSPPLRVWGWTGDYDGERPGEGSYQASVEFENGVRATSIYSGYDHFDTNEFTAGLGEARAIGQTWRRASEIVGVDEGELKRRTIDPPTRSSQGSEGVYGFTLLNGEAADARPSASGNALLYSRDGRAEYELGGPSGTDLIAQEFFDSVANGAPALHDGRYGLSVLELCLAVRRSADGGGGAVELDHQYEIPTSAIAGVIGDRELATTGID